MEVRANREPLRPALVVMGIRTPNQRQRGCHRGLLSMRRARRGRKAIGRHHRWLDARTRELCPERVICATGGQWLKVAMSSHLSS